LIWDLKDFLLLGGWVITILGWIVQYRFSLQSKKKDFTVPILNGIRNETEIYFSSMVEATNRKEHYYQFPNELNDKN
jgi:hypothetical protein